MILVAASAATHCIMGCVAGEVIGMVTAASVGLDHEGMSSWSIAVAFLLGYGITSLRLIRQARFGAILWIGMASAAISVSVIEAIDGLAMASVPKTADPGVRELAYWATLASGARLAHPLAFRAIRGLIRRERSLGWTAQSRHS